MKYNSKVFNIEDGCDIGSHQMEAHVQPTVTSDRTVNLGRQSRAQLGKSKSTV